MWAFGQSHVGFEFARSFGQSCKLHRAFGKSHEELMVPWAFIRSYMGFENCMGFLLVMKVVQAFANHARI